VGRLCGVDVDGGIVGIGERQEEFGKVANAAKHAMTRNATGIVVKVMFKRPATNFRDLLQLPFNESIFLPQE
jgi:hypothetical protein